MDETKNSENGKTNDKQAEKGKIGFINRLAGIGQTWLALLIIVPAFILIATMLVVQNDTVSRGINSFNWEVNVSDPEQVNAVTNFFKEMNSSNQTIFAIMLSVFGAWVGAVVAFYFGTQSLTRSQESLDKAQSFMNKSFDRALSAQEGKVEYKTIGDVLADQREKTTAITVKMQNKIKEVNDIFKKDESLTNVLVVDENDKPLGILYAKNFNDKIVGSITANDFDKPLLEYIDKIENDWLTEGSWSKTKGIKNFATLYEDTTLEAALAQMNEIGQGDNKVRGVVVDKASGKVKGIIDYQVVAGAVVKKV